MLVSHRKKFIYTKTLKTGGTSVEAYFERYCMPSDEWSLVHEREVYVSEHGIIGFRGANHPDTWWNHMPAAIIKGKVGIAVWETYFKFCVIRNPYDKVASSFYWNAYKQPEGKTSIGRVGLGDLDNDRMEFEHWLQYCHEIPIDRDKYLIDGQFCLDDVIRYELLTADLERICSRLAIPWDPAALPAFKSGIRPRYARTCDLYTENAKKLVQDAFAFELDYFNYSFPDRD